MSVDAANSERKGLTASSSDWAVNLRSGVEIAIERAQGNLLRLQKPEGYWIGELMVDCTLVADMIAYHHWNGTVDPEYQRKAVNHLFSLQLPEGGWNIYHGGPARTIAACRAGPCMIFV